MFRTLPADEVLMSVFGARAGPFELVARADVPGARTWYAAKRRVAMRTVPERALVCLAGPPGAPDPHVMAELRSQLDLLRAIQDPRIPTPIGVYEDVGAIAVTMVTGSPLTGAIRARAGDALHLTPATVLDVLLELSEAVARAHGRRTVHGQLHSDFVWLTDMGSLWILGFGEPHGAPRPASWVPPEVARGQPATYLTDQWSLAALACAMLSGAEPWPAPASLGQAEQGVAAPMLALVERQWPALAEVLQRMLAAEPSDRFATLGVARQELMALARQAGSASERRQLGAWLASRAPFEPLRADFRPVGPAKGDPSLESTVMQEVAETEELPSLGAWVGQPVGGRPAAAGPSSVDVEPSMMRTQLFTESPVQFGLGEPHEGESLETAETTPGELLEQALLSATRAEGPAGDPGEEHEEAMSTMFHRTIDNPPPPEGAAPASLPPSPLPTAPPSPPPQSLPPRSLPPTSLPPRFLHEEETAVRDTPPPAPAPAPRARVPSLPPPRPARREPSRARIPAGMVALFVFLLVSGLFVGWAAAQLFQP